MTGMAWSLLCSSKRAICGCFDKNPSLKNIVYFKGEYVVGGEKLCHKLKTHIRGKEKSSPTFFLAGLCTMVNVPSTRIFYKKRVIHHITVLPFQQDFKVYICHYVIYSRP